MNEKWKLNKCKSRCCFATYTHTHTRALLRKRLLLYVITKLSLFFRNIITWERDKDIWTVHLYTKVDHLSFCYIYFYFYMRRHEMKSGIKKNDNSKKMYLEVTLIHMIWNVYFRFDVVFFAFKFDEFL